VIGWALPGTLLPAACFWLANHVFMPFAPYRARHWFLRRYCGLVLGEGSSICAGCFITGTHVRIGANSVVNRGTYLDGRGGLHIGDNVNISHQALLQTLTHDPRRADFAVVALPVTIHNHVWIGARAIICPGVTLGEGAVVGAGAVVTRDVAAWTIVAGNPARRIGDRPQDIAYRTHYRPWFDTDIE
jgi:acetyltransferase-like isoleucine patch superfamily enzyme